MPFDGTLSGLLLSSLINILLKNDLSIALRLCAFASLREKKQFHPKIHFELKTILLCDLCVNPLLPLRLRKDDLFWIKLKK